MKSNLSNVIKPWLQVPSIFDALMAV